MIDKTNMKKILSSVSWFSIIGIGLTTFLLASCNESKSGKAGPLEEFTGSHTRVVWVQEQGNGGDTFGFGGNFKLMGYDSRDGKGERALLKDVENFYKPILTPDGKKVVVSSRSRHEIYLVDFERGKRKKLGKGVAVDVWEDPATGKTWVYALAGDGPENKYFTTRPLIRFSLKKPKKRQLVWDKTHLSWSNFDMSRDGKLAGGLFPWPHAGILVFEENTWKKYGKGCWTALSPDNSGILWGFDGLHRNLNFVNPFTAEFWTTNINNAAGIEGFEVYHPRWSNHVRYLTMTGPYVEGEGGNKITGGGKKVEIHVGRFSADLKSVEDWFQVSHNELADFFPDVWIEDGKTSVFSSETKQELIIGNAEEELEWPQGREQLLFFWQDVLAENKLDDNALVGFSQFRVVPGQRGLFNRYLEMNLNGSGFTASFPEDKVVGIMKSRKEMGLEFLFTPAGTSDTDSGLVLRLQDADGDNSLLISQQGAALVVEVSVKGKVIGGFSTLSILHAQRPEHLFVDIDQKSLALDSNGSLIKKVALSQNLFASMASIKLLFGDPVADSTGIRGSLSHVALFAGKRSASQITRNAHLVTGPIEARKNAERVHITAELVEASSVPAPDSLGAYRRALVVNRYKVLKVEQGAYPEKEVLVAQWAVLDREVLPETKTFVPGNTLDMIVEKFDDHPELEGERLMMDMFDPDLELYYQVIN